ncbi:MAG: hypothetical protein ACKPKO_39240, partial [Candidatus Fonsibacter sp.]
MKGHSANPQRGAHSRLLPSQRGWADQVSVGGIRGLRYEAYRLYEATAAQSLYDIQELTAVRLAAEREVCWTQITTRSSSKNGRDLC